MIRREDSLKNFSEEILKSPGKMFERISKRTELDDFDLCIIIKSIYNFDAPRKEFLQLKKFQKP
jgi:hypothetical protein